MQRLVKPVAAVLFLAFLPFWVVGIVRTWNDAPPPPVVVFSAPEEYALSQMRNWNNTIQLGLADTPLPALLDKIDLSRVDVHQKAARMTVSSAAFEEDETRVRSALAKHKAVIFDERKSGIAPERHLSLDLGVHPDEFESFADQLKRLGKLEKFTIHQRDRTDEFKKLHAQRQALKSHLEAILKLRGAKSASIDDSLKLEQKVQEIERELQLLGVQLGDFLSKESFYHVQLSLHEFSPGTGADRKIELTGRLMHGFLWAVPRWLLVVVAAGLLAATYLSVRILREAIQKR